MTAPLLAADRCPSCQNVHGQPTGWPVCPDHGHWLYVVSGPLKTGEWTYACQAPKCTHTHTQKEKATMTATHETSRSLLAIRDGQGYWDDNQLAALAQLGIPRDISKPEMRVFMHYCQRTGLDPFSKQIYLIPTKNGHAVQVGIDGFRIIASRAARRDGVLLSYGPTKWIDDDEVPHEVWIRNDPPAAASITVYVDGRPFSGTVSYRSFAQLRNGKPIPGSSWADKPDHMLAKCAEAQALRRAFPHDLAGIQTDDEAGRSGNRAPHFSAQQAEAPTPRKPRRQPAPEPPEPDPEYLKQVIGAQFRRLGLDGIDNAEERDAYLRLLTGEEDLASLTIEHMARAVADLESCDDIGHLQYITGETGDEE